MQFSLIPTISLQKKPTPKLSSQSFRKDVVICCGFLLTPFIFNNCTHARCICWFLISPCEPSQACIQTCVKPPVWALVSDALGFPIAQGQWPFIHNCVGYMDHAHSCLQVDFYFALLCCSWTPHTTMVILLDNTNSVSLFHFTWHGTVIYNRLASLLSLILYCIFLCWLGQLSVRWWHFHFYVHHLVNFLPNVGTMSGRDIQWLVWSWVVTATNVGIGRVKVLKAQSSPCQRVSEHSERSQAVTVNES